MNDENISKLLAISDLLYKKMLELIARIRATERKMRSEPDSCSKEHSLNIEEELLKKSFRVFGFPKVGGGLSYPFYGLVEELQMSLPQIIQLSEENLYFGIRIDL